MNVTKEEEEEYNHHYQHSLLLYLGFSLNYHHFFLTSESFVRESSVLSGVSPLQCRLLLYLGGVFNDRSGVTHTDVSVDSSMLLPTLSPFSLSS